MRLSYRIKVLSIVLSSVLLFQTMLVEAVEFQISADPVLFPEPQSARLYVFVSNDLEKEPRTRVSQFKPSPNNAMYAIDVNDWDGTTPITIDNKSLFFPIKMNQLQNTTYRVQALLRTNLDAAKAVSGAGNLISQPINVEIDGTSSSVIKLKLNSTIPERKFVETKRIKEVVFHSDLLSKFHHRDYTLKASVALPLHFDPTKKYPVLYSITGFGGSHFSMGRMLKFMGSTMDNLILVIPDATNYYGHSAFVNSDTIGPWGDALVHELIPHIEKQYGGIGAKQRYLTGISSGGWSSLWLQINYPDEFNGVWSMVPDPVDFHNFQNINLYRAGENMYVDRAGKPRPLARRNGKVMIGYKEFVQMEELLGAGGQIRSFEATYSPRGEDGKPMPIFDRKTGEINTALIATWKRFDINHILTTNWKILAPKLKGKLHIYAGGEDTFYLEGAVKLLKKSLADLGSDAVVKIIPGMPHKPAPGVFAEMANTIENNLHKKNIDK